MSLVPPELSVQAMSCPHCGREILSSAVRCKFCSNPLTEELKEFFIRKEAKAAIQKKMVAERNVAFFGVALTALGGFCFVPPISAVGCFPVFLIAVGVGLTVKGYAVYRDEKSKLENV